MNSIVKASVTDAMLLADIGKVSFVESHGSSATPAVIEKYVREKYTEDVLREELSDPGNIYHIIYHNQEPAGYAKINLNVSHPNIAMENLTKLERIYLLKKFYGLHLGLELFQFNLQLSKMNNQSGMWLFVWKENQRAVQFYEKTGFRIVGSYDFKLTETHANPNHQMLLVY